MEIQADVILKGTRVDGVYTADPEKNPSAVKYDTLTFEEAYEKGLKIMDLTAFALCMENKMPIVVFNMNQPGNLLKIIHGETPGTIVT
jgi:uridylate kinase